MRGRRGRKDPFCGYGVALIGPPGELRDKLEHEIPFATCGSRMIRYDSAKDCTWEDLRRCAALYFILDSREEIDAVHALRPGDQHIWPLVMITTNVDFGIDAFALGACHCLLPPLEREALREGFHRCLQKQEDHVIIIRELQPGDRNPLDRLIVRIQKRFVRWELNRLQKQELERRRLSIDSRAANYDKV